MIWFNSNPNAFEFVTEALGQTLIIQLSVLGDAMFFLWIYT